MGISRAALVFGGSAVALVVTMASCLDPTQITVDIATDVKCVDTKGTAIAGGTPGTLELASPTTSTRDCDNGHVGTLVSTPSDSKDVDAAFMVVLGVDRPVSECTADNHFKGCIVQRRLIHYVKHTPLDLPITMWLVCKDIECGPDTTCARSGKCVSARIADPASCAGSPCFVEGDGPYVPGTGTDAGTDGGTDSPVIVDGAITDGPVRDADGDAPPVVIPPDPPGKRMFCPPVAAGCDPGGPCCFDHQGFGGRCSPGCNAQAEITMRCNQKNDCSGTDLCCGTVTGSKSVGVPPPPLPLRGPKLLPNPFPDDSGIEAGVDTRVLTETNCAATCNSGSNTWVCRSNADCPLVLPKCVTSTLFNPNTIFGECSP